MYKKHVMNMLTTFQHFGIRHVICQVILQPLFGQAAPRMESLGPGWCRRHIPTWFLSDGTMFCSVKTCKKDPHPEYQQVRQSRVPGVAHCMNVAEFILLSLLSLQSQRDYTVGQGETGIELAASSENDLSYDLTMLFLKEIHVINLGGSKKISFCQGAVNVFMGSIATDPQRSRNSCWTFYDKTTAQTTLSSYNFKLQNLGIYTFQPPQKKGDMF